MVYAPAYLSLNVHVMTVTLELTARLENVLMIVPVGETAYKKQEMRSVNVILDILELIVRIKVALMIAIIMEFALMRNVIVGKDLVAILVSISHVRIIARRMGSVLKGNVFVKMDLWERYLKNINI